MLGEEREVEEATAPVSQPPSFPPVDPLMTQLPTPPATGVTSDPSSWPPPAWPAPAWSPPPHPATGPPGYDPFAAYAPPGAQQYGAQPYGTQQYGTQQYGTQPYGTQQYGTQQYGTQPYGTQPFPYAPAPLWMPAPARPRMKRRTVVIAVVTVLALLVSTVGGVAFTLRSADQRRQEALRAATAAVTEHLPGLEKFVATTTARPWKRAVMPEVLDDTAFVAALHGGSSDATSTPGDDDDDIGVTVAAMGLADSADEFWAAYNQGTEDNVVGFYDDSTGRLVVRGAAWSPDLEYTLVHELTHANQDQSFDLSTMWEATRTDDESATALRGLVEGEASLVADDYYQSQSSSWQRAVDARSSTATESRIPVVDTLAGFPYRAGERFVAGLRAAGGSAAITAAYAKPPRYSRDLVDPAGWLAGTLPKVTKPPLPTNVGRANADTADYGMLGVVGLWMTADGGAPDPADIGRLDGWTGDAYVATENRDTQQVCFTDDVTFASVAARDKAVAFLQPWITKSGTKADDTSPTSIRLHRCHG